VIFCPAEAVILNGNETEFDYNDFWENFDITTGKPIIKEVIDGKNGPMDGATWDGLSIAGGVTDPIWSHQIYATNPRLKNKKYREWRDKVIETAGNVCQKCNSPKATHVHHIKNFAQYPKLRHKRSNGILFCRDCHEKFHKKYGYRGNNAIELKEFLLI
jgi:hypothetical protein